MNTGTSLLGRVMLALFSALALAGLAAGAAKAAAGDTTLVSVGLFDNPADGGGSAGASVSGSGRFVAFSSDASNRVGGDTNDAEDVFVRDRENRRTVRVSVSSAGGQSNGYSFTPAISADGRHVAFVSEATNLTARDVEGSRDVFVHDRLAGTTRLVNVSNSGDLPARGGVNPSISADGRHVAFESSARDLVRRDTNGAVDVFVRDLRARTTRLVSRDGSGGQANGPSGAASISADGSVVAFGSGASDLVPEDTNGAADVFVRDRATGTTERVSVNDLPGPGSQADAGSQDPSISADGRFVAFDSGASNLVAGDTNTDINGRNASDVFVRDRLNGTTERVSLSGEEEEGDDPSRAASISADGRFVGFESLASNLTPDDTDPNGGNGAGTTIDVFVRDRQSGTTELVSASGSGEGANDTSDGASISADGRYAAFRSVADNLVANDTNARFDVFAHQLLP